MPSDINLVSRDQEIQLGAENDSAPNDIKKPKESELQTIEKNEIVDINETQKEKILGDARGKSQGQKRAEKPDPNAIKKDTTNAQPMGLDPNAQNQNQSKVPLKTIDQLLIHNSDTAVKPIIGNKDIEKSGELVYNP